MKLYNDKEVLDFIRQQISPVSLLDDEIRDIIDALYDYYDDNGLLDIDYDEDSDEAEDDVDLDQIAYILSSEIDYPKGTILSVIKAENKYQDSLL